MGLIKTTARLIPYATVFLIGYYAGTLDSGKHEQVFCEKPHVHEEYYQDETLEARLENDPFLTEHVFTYHAGDDQTMSGVMVYEREARSDNDR